MVGAQRKVLAVWSEARNRLTLSRQKGTRWQGLNLFLVKHKKIPRRVLILKLTFICKASVEISFRSDDNVIEELNVKKITSLFYFLGYL